MEINQTLLEELIKKVIELKWEIKILQNINLWIRVVLV